MLLRINFLYFFLPLLTAGQAPENPDTAYGSLKALHKNADSLEYPMVYLNTYRELAEQHGDSAQYALSLLDKAETISRKLLNNRKMIEILELRGRFFAERGDYAQALKVYTEGLNHINARDSVNYLREGWFFIGFGNLLFKIGRYPEAKQLYTEAWKRFQKSNSLYGQAVVQNNRGLCALRLDSPAVALEYFKKGIYIREKLNNKFLLAHSYLYLAQAQLELGAYTKSDSLLKQAEKYSLEAHEREFRKEVYKLWAELEMQMNNPQRAEHYLNMSLKEDMGFYNNFYNTEILFLSARIHQKKGNLEKAKKDALQGVKLAKKNKQFEMQGKLLELLVKLNQRHKNFEQALQYSNQLIALDQKRSEEKEALLADFLQVQKNLSKERKNSDILALKNKNKSQTIRNQNLIIIISIIAVALTLTGLFIVFRLNRKLKITKSTLVNLGIRLEAAADSSSSIVLSIDAKGRILYLNKAAKNFFQTFDGATFNARKPLANQLNKPASKTYWQKKLKKSRSHKSWEEVSEFPLQAHSYFFLLSFSSIYQNQKFTGIVVVGADVTENQNQTAALARKTKELEKSNADKEEIISLLAHDLKNGIVSPHELTKTVNNTSQEFSREELLEMFKIMGDSLSKTRNLLTKTLDWVKTQKGGFKVNRQNFSLKNLIDEVEEEFTEKLEEKGVTIEVDLDGYLQVKADPEMIRTVLRNLIGNALKFSDSEQGHIRVFSKEKQETLTLHVKDNGQGINAYDLGKIIHDPGQLSRTGTAGEKGTGMGLKLCQELLALNKTSLQVVSEQGSGSDFYFSLPLVTKQNPVI